MPTYRVTLAKDKAKAVWTLRWDDASFVLKDPDGQPVLEVETARAHDHIDLTMAFFEGTFAIKTSGEELTFSRHDPAIAALKKLVADGLRLDPEYRAAMASRSRYWVFFGAGLFVFATALFVAFCWYFAGTPEPPPDHWFHTFRRIFKYAVTAVLGVIFVGMWMCFSGARTLWRIRGIERTLQARKAEGDV